MRPGRYVPLHWAGLSTHVERVGAKEQGFPIGCGVEGSSRALFAVGCGVLQRNSDWLLEARDSISSARGIPAFGARFAAGLGPEARAGKG